MDHFFTCWIFLLITRNVKIISIFENYLKNLFIKEITCAIHFFSSVPSLSTTASGYEEILKLQNPANETKTKMTIIHVGLFVCVCFYCKKHIFFKN